MTILTERVFFATQPECTDRSVPPAAPIEQRDRSL